MRRKAKLSKSSCEALARRLAGALLATAVSVSCSTREAQKVDAASTGGRSDAPRAQVIEATRVISQRPSVTFKLPGELAPYEVVAIYPKVTGFVEWIRVDRGSRVRAGSEMAQLVAPEITSQRAEAAAKLQSVEAQRIEGEAKLAADEDTYQRLKAASATPGVVAGNELEVAGKNVEADRARVQALREGEQAGRAALDAVREIEGYLKILAPFDGVVTERNVHPGALVGPAGGPGTAVPMVRVEKTSRLRLVVPVPETYVAGIPEGTKVAFTVPAFPGETFNGTVARIAHSVDVKTRTMPVELDVQNPSRRLAPGMFPEVLWPVRRPEPTLFVPVSAVARTTERVFVVRVSAGKAEWVDVQAGVTSGNLVEVFGGLREGDLVAQRGTDELREGAPVVPREQKNLPAGGQTEGRR